MMNRRANEYLLYAVVIILSLVVLGLVALAPNELIEAAPVYKGF